MLSVKKNNSIYLFFLLILLFEEFFNEDHYGAHEFLIWLLDNINETLKEQNKKIKSGVNFSDSVWFILIILYFNFRHF